ncbi:MAG: outer membrane lipoprotein-sorting protein [Bacteroidota bacterium]
MKFLSFILLSCSLVIGLQAQDQGLQIAQKAHDLDEGYGSYQVNLKMILKNANGQESTRLMSSKTFEVQEDGDKSLISFMEPKDVKGTSMLTYSHKKGSDDQWLFLPSIKRVKRISSNNKSGPFMGSEIAYEDLGSQEVEKYTYKYIEASELNGSKVAIVERYPVDRKSGYSKHKVYFNLDQQHRIEKIEFYDRKGTLLKVMDYLNYQLYKDKHWRAAKIQVVNNQSKKETQLLFDNYDFETALKENNFTQNSLRRN